jgi:D-serine deaminase-like pyridoxal phosphate-dependent protein
VTRLADLETPAVLVDLDLLERNVARMAAAAQRAGVRLRPHAKTHKCPEIGRMQLRAGAAGLSLAKVGEAEVFAAAGFEDLFIAYPVVGEDKGRRLLALGERVRLAAGTDSLEGAATLSRAFANAGRKLDVLLKVDVGFHRVGVHPDSALDVARRIADLPGLRLRGVFTHAGHAYGSTERAQVAAVGVEEGRALAATADRLRAAGLPIEEVSVGSTPTASASMAVPGITECRPGNYVFHDASQVSLGTCAPSDCALTVLATVVSVPARDRAVVDAGSKTLSSDALRPRPDGHGWVLSAEGGVAARIARLSEEHGVIEPLGSLVPHVGDRVRILPNHACVVANLHDVLHGVRGDEVVTRFEVAARGRVT